MNFKYTHRNGCLLASVYRNFTELKIQKTTLVKVQRITQGRFSTQTTRIMYICSLWKFARVVQNYRYHTSNITQGFYRFL